MSRRTCERLSLECTAVSHAESLLETNKFAIYSGYRAREGNAWLNVERDNLQRGQTNLR